MNKPIPEERLLNDLDIISEILLEGKAGEEKNEEQLMESAKLIAGGNRTEVIEREIFFDAPKKDAIVDVIGCAKSAKITEARVEEDNVIVSGYLHNCIQYSSIKRPPAPKQEQSSNQGKHGYGSSNNNNSNKQKGKPIPKPCCRLTGENIAVDGVIRHTTVFIPFRVVVMIKDVKKGDLCKVTNIEVLEEPKALEQVAIYESELDMEQESIAIKIPESENIFKANETEGIFIKGVIDKSVLNIDVEVYRTN